MSKIKKCRFCGDTIYSFEKHHRCRKTGSDYSTQATDNSWMIDSFLSNQIDHGSSHSHGSYDSNDYSGGGHFSGGGSSDSWGSSHSDNSSSHDSGSSYDSGSSDSGSSYSSSD